MLFVSRKEAPLAGGGVLPSGGRIATAAWRPTATRACAPVDLCNGVIIKLLGEVPRERVVRVGSDRESDGGPVETGRRAALLADTWIDQSHPAVDRIHAASRVDGRAVPFFVVPEADTDAGPLREIS